MSYLVLARKWRPRSFDTIVGQDHVVRALTHALSTGRLHHAWLFTGTRGVGKTTLARILAKSLNCISGITSSPCGECAACTEIDAGRFVDYIELDAASNRGVDEMTQLLEQAVYSPASGRFKVYMIDEVHMLSGHAFNAMLKTLEEPPAHVKFILATTDPQKIPVTVLSRCLQFNLKQMTADGIIGYLSKVLDAEHIPYEIEALRLLARAASGSMRDALSLTDQAIAFSADSITLSAMQNMLGTIDHGYLITLLKGISSGQANVITEIADQLATMGLSYSSALADTAVLLSRIALEQKVPGSTATSDPQHDSILELSKTLHPDVVQLCYSVAVHSRSEMSIAPDEYAGFIMACFRMLSLIPIQNTEKAQKKTLLSNNSEVDTKVDITKTQPQTFDRPIINLQSITSESWPALVQKLPLTGAAGEVARQSEWISVNGNIIRLRMPVQTLGKTTATNKLSQVLSEYIGSRISVELEYAATGNDTVHAIQEAHKAKLQQQAEDKALNDPLVNQLLTDFQGQIVKGSVKPL